MKVPLPPNESQRLKALHDYGILDTPPEREFDDITALAAEICEAPIALISIVDETRQWFKSKVGLATQETSRDEAFCAHALTGNNLLLVPDALLDRRFADNPSVTGDPSIRFYAGAPLITSGGETLGTLCVIDRVPRQLTDRQQRALHVLSQQVMTQLELRRQTRALAARERLLLAIFDSEPECVKVLGPDGSLRMMNRAGLAMIEADTFGEIAGHCVYPMVAPNHRATFAALTERVFRGDSDKLEFQLNGLKGAMRWLETHAAPLRDEHGKVTALLGITRDITARKQTEEALAVKSGILAAVNESLASYVERGDWRDAMGRLLQCALHQTQSEYGFIGVVVGTTLRVLAHEGIVWDKIINRDFYEQALRRYEELGYLEFTNFNNLFGRAITTGQVVIANMPDHDPRSAGRPTGHPPMHSFLGVPIFAGQQVLGLVALANRPGGYTEEDQHRIETLVQHAGGLCASYRQREAGLLLEQERLKTESALRSSEERFRLLSNATNDAIWDWDFTTSLRWWNEGYEKLFGHRHVEGSQSITSWTDYIHPEDLPRVQGGVQHVIENGGTDWTDEYRFRRHDGAYVHVLDRGHIIRDAAGQARRMIGGMTDLTESRRITEEVQQQAALIDQARDAILVRDLEHRVIFWSKGAERLYGWTAAEAIGRMIHELIQPEPVVLQAAEEGVLRAGEWSGEIRKVAKDGTRLILEGRWTLLRDSEGRPKSILSIETDITERKKLEQQFLRAQRMESIGTLAGGIAHDLNNLLAPIMMGVGLLKQFDPSPQSLPVLDTMERSARRGAELVKQVLSFARGVEGTRIALQLRHVIHDILSITRNTFPKNITVEMDSNPDLWLVLGDVTQLNQVLLNLCVNARDAMPDGGRLELKASNVELDEQYAVMNHSAAPGRYVAVKVADSGIGIPKENIDRIFEPFFTTKELGNGTGLGLSTVLGIVRSHGGFVNVYSEPGKGSTFTVYLPAQSDGALADDGRLGEDRLPRGHGELILVVDDETSILHITKQTLETFGYQVVTAEDGAQAIGLYALHRNEIAAVLTDMMMPVMDGPALIAALRRINPKVPIIAASGLNANANLSRVGGLGVQHFLPKPYSADTMLNLLKRILREGESRPPFQPLPSGPSSAES